MNGTVRATQLRLLAVGVPGLRHVRRGRLRHHQRRAEPPGHRLLDRERRHARPAPPSTATPAPAGRARSATRSGCRSTSAPPRRSARSALTWEAAYATAFQIQTAPTATGPWTTIYSTTTGTGGTQTLTVTGTGRYVRMNGTARATQFGYSLLEMAVFTTGGTTSAAAGRRRPRAERAHLRPVDVGTATIQSQLDSVFAAQETNQFGTQRYALLFKPGTYNDQRQRRLLHLGRSASAATPTTSTSTATSPSTRGWFGGNATQNFWRSAENLIGHPSAGGDRWAVAQAAPFRRIDVHGDLNLAPTGFGWASGGYIADSRVIGAVQPVSQQQWFTRDSQHRQLDRTPSGTWSSPACRARRRRASRARRTPRSRTTPVIREKPYLYVDARRRVPACSCRRCAPTPPAPPGPTGTTPGTSLPLSQFYVAKPGDTRGHHQRGAGAGPATCSSRRASTTSTRRINVTRANTVVLGLGLRHAHPGQRRRRRCGRRRRRREDRRAAVRRRHDQLAGAAAGRPDRLDRRPRRQPDLAPGRVLPHRRRGSPARRPTSLLVNSNNAIIDHIWAWRADHGNAGRRLDGQHRRHTA